ncbi:MAG TPA: sigma-70 family RNA polymerase sigma factor [Nocardioidaceae bacterium]|nr:sigma-70 family RNA polymerase sigma factor [Nocardioidaceae bacterium]
MATVGRTRDDTADGDSGDLVRMYLAEIGRVPLLTAADEVELAHAIEVGVLAAARITESAGSLSAADRADLGVLVRRGEAAKGRLVQANLRLVVAIAKRYRTSGASLLDLVQEGNLGLIRAVEKFDYQKGFKFSTYATWWIRQAVVRGVANHGRAIRVPTHVAELMQRLRRMQRSHFEETGRTPSTAEIAAGIQSTPERVCDLLRLAEDPVSLDARVGESGDGELVDLVVDDLGDVRLMELSRNMLRADLEQLMLVATPREYHVLQLRFGLGGSPPRTLEEVAGSIGVSRERVRQIEAKALARIRRHGQVETLREYLEA